ncbi:integral membrane protein, YjbE family [Belnapia rosea]|uniref:Integral membrane protein, YjbE family n=1 Tax=Belnapia rosea TaxID=938405 RepID=A0A1G6YM20_9PROT|nr:integral membrane protein, YjbE family [Belnapia rosea]SDD91341.1 integral membrane protein, YjbE family [Belnapia rosea]
MPEWLVPLAQVLFIDLVLAGDNAIVVGMAAAGLPVEQRRKAIFWGIIAATVMRIGFAAITAQLLAVVGITLAGGVLLLWVCWKMFRELRAHHEAEPTAALAEAEATAPRKTLPQAITQILVADVSMSLDNVLAVAGAAKEHTWVLVGGLGISVVLMGVAATLIANLLNRHRWIAWVGLAVILYVAVDMIWEGTHQVAGQVPGAYAYLMLPLGYLALPHVFPAWIWAAATLLQVVVVAALATGTVTLLRKAGGRDT